MDTSQLTTKSDVKELKTEIKFIRGDVLKIDERVENLEEGQKRIEAKLDRIANTLDGFVGTVDDLRTDNTVGTYRAREVQITVDDHEKRLKQIEKSQQTA